MRLLISIPDFTRTEPFGRTQTYKLIDEGAFETVLIGARRYIVAESYKAYVEGLREAGTTKRASPNPKAKTYARGGHGKDDLPPIGPGDDRKAPAVSVTCSGCRGYAGCKDGCQAPRPKPSDNDIPAGAARR